MIGSEDSALLDRLLRIRSHRVGEALIVAVAGEVDAFTAAKLETALGAVLDQTGGPVVVDLSGVPFLASRGIAVLLASTTEARLRQRRLCIVVGTSTAVRRPLEVLGLDEALPLYGTVQQALDALDEPAGSTA